MKTITLILSFIVIIILILFPIWSIIVSYKALFTYQNIAIIGLTTTLFSMSCIYMIVKVVKEEYFS